MEKSIMLKSSDGANLSLIWLVYEFSNFHPFSTFKCNFDGVYLFSASKKAHDYDPHIFIFVLVYNL